jgi:hypothetical protein
VSRVRLGRWIVLVSSLVRLLKLDLEIELREVRLRLLLDQKDIRVSVLILLSLLAPW